jgi:hypothetical protein
LISDIKHGHRCEDEEAKRDTVAMLKDLKKILGFGEEKPEVKIEGVPVEIFRAGNYGRKGSYTESDLDALVDSFDPKFHEPPITLQHEDKQGPHGVIERLERKGRSLFATFKNVSKELKAWLEERPYAKRSIEIYGAEISPTGKPMVRAVSFVTVPEVKGMDPLPAFQDERGAYEALDEAGMGCVDLFGERKLMESWGGGSDWHCHFVMTDEKGNGTTSGPVMCKDGGRVIDEEGHTHAVKYYKIAEAEGHKHGLSVTTGEFSEEGQGTKDKGQTEGGKPEDTKEKEDQVLKLNEGSTTAMPDTNKDKTQEGAPVVDAAALEQMRKESEQTTAKFQEDLKARDARIAELEKKGRRQELTARLAGCGLAPAVVNFPGLHEFLEGLAEKGGVVAFGEGDKRQEVDTVKFVLDFAEHTAKVGRVPMGETGAPAYEGPAGGDPELDQDSVKLDKAAKKFMEDHKGVDYREALMAVSRK